MGWFRRRTEPRSRVALIREGSAKAAGAAALLSPKRVLTCAHVVNDALGREPLSADEPDRKHPLAVAFHGAGTTAHGTARLSVWLPPQQRASKVVWDGDLAVLELDEPAPDWTRPVVWREMTEGLGVRAWHGGGETITYADTVVGLEDDGCCYLDGELTGAAIGPGYSGGPLWVRSDSTVAGLVVAQVLPAEGALGSQDTVRRGWAVPWQTVRKELERADAGDVLTECRIAAPADAGTGGSQEASVSAGLLIPALRALLDDPARRAGHCRGLAADIGCVPPPETDPSAPSVDELAALLLTEERALATLAESLAPTLRDGAGRQALNDLLALGRVEPGVRLLSVGEHRQLLAALRTVTVADPALIPRAAREALRFMALPGPLGCAGRLAEAELEGVVLGLEDCPDGPVGDLVAPPVPALLKLAAFVAAAASGTEARRTLHLWCDRVAERLGISRAALAERRADAAAWASHRPPPAARVVTRLSEAGPDAPDRYHCETWLFHRDGTRATVPTPKGALTPDDIGRLIREAADRCRAEGGEPATQVDVVVGRDGLQIPVEAWRTGSEFGDLFPDLSLALGARYQVALRCPDATRRPGEVRRRWSAPGPSALVVTKPATALELYEQLLDTPYKDTARVVLHGPPEQREELLAICLAMGVPVVLWDRAAGSIEDAGRLDDLDPTGPLHKLPQRLQEFRAAALGSKKSSAARPVLVWDDCELPLPGPLELADPA
ncbi:hypothetical protein ABZ070_12940 [Streptomyces sp. NPDC006283]|uniref:VMAP-C domain-containing protein n=1 Tax=Streptomyces sp. NPDC006283 TaxID=3156741 RepID=UPI00339F47D3